MFFPLGFVWGSWSQQQFKERTLSQTRLSLYKLCSHLASSLLPCRQLVGGNHRFGTTFNGPKLLAEGHPLPFTPNTRPSRWWTACGKLGHFPEHLVSFARMDLQSVASSAGLERCFSTNICSQACGMGFALRRWKCSLSAQGFSISK